MKFYVQNSKGIFSFVLLFTLILTSNQIAFAQFICQPSGPIDGFGGSLTTTDPTQNGRVFRDGNPSGCAGGAPTQAPLAGTYHYDSYNFTAPAGLTMGCATLNYNFSGCTGNQVQATVYSSYNPASPGANIIGTSGLSSSGSASLSFPVNTGTTFTVVIAEVVADSGCANYGFIINYSTACRQVGFDRTNDGKADITYWRPSTGFWDTINSAGGTNSVQFGQSGDIITAGDYTGDGQTDVGVYRPGNNVWYYGLSQTTPSANFYAQAFGISGDVPVPGDYDGDSKTDIAVWRPGNGYWYVLRSSDNTLLSQQWGQAGDAPVVGDFDGDRMNDFGIVRPNDVSTGNTANRWYILESDFNYTRILSAAFGIKTDKLVPGDYDGDAKSDIAVWRPSDGIWYYLKSSTLAVGTTAVTDSFQFGASGDIPQPADYDGDKKMDFAVYRSGNWFIYNSQSNTVSGFLWGTATDQPATSPYRIQ
ncbi:MAG: VCBS repeat-containing protein [Acidobacteriota bacterium]